MKKRKRRKPDHGPLRAAAAWALVGLLAAGSGLALAAGKKKSKAVPQALLFGNVFQENGFSVRGARVVIANADRPKDRQEITTDVQGEFAARVPAGKARYTVGVSAEGFAPAQKTVEIFGDERVDLTFRLTPLSK